MAAVLKIGGAEMPAPVSCTMTYQDIDNDSGRDIKTCKMKRNIARADVRTLSCQWQGLSKSDTTTLYNAITAKNFTVTFYDPKAGTDTTFTAYRGDRKTSYQKVGKAWILTLDVDFVEV